MATTLEETQLLGTAQFPKARWPVLPTGKSTMYAIAFDLDTDTLRKTYGSDSYNNAYGDIKKVLTNKHNFNWQQGSVYFGDPAKVNAVSCVLAIMDVSRTFAWFAPSVRDIRMLRIEEQNDLMGAVQQAKAE
jgi:virulence-associated protein VapD